MSFYHSIKSNLIGPIPFFLFLLSGIIFLAFLFSSCAVNPVTGKQELMLLSEQDEIRLGEKTDREIIKQYGLYEDRSLNEYLNELCKSLGKVSHRPHLNFQLKIIDTPIINAFAVPGGYIYFTRGILAALNSEAELAGVIGHEIGHITARHSAQQYSKAQLAQIGLGLGSIFVDSPLLTQLGAFGVELLFLKFSRDNEREADRLGVEYASKVGYDATSLASFFEMLNNMSPGADKSGLPDWFSTHPSPENRIPMVRSEAYKWQNTLNYRQYKVERERYLRKIDGLIYGEDPRQGYVSEGIFYHPLLKFQFPVPSQWNVINRPAQVEIVSDLKDALLFLSISSASSAREAVSSFVTKNRPNVIQSEPAVINKFSAFRLVSEIRSQNDALIFLSYFIEKDKKVFVFHGLSTPKRFQNYKRVFEGTIQGFKELTDPKRIGVSPYRVRIRQVKTSNQVESVLRSFGVSNEKIKENVLINGLSPGQIVPSGTLIKVIEKD